MKTDWTKAAAAADRRRGSLVAGAAGDALGYAVEFYRIGQIRQKYGPNGIEAYRFDPDTGNAVISDDTQMTLFTAEGLLQPTGEPLQNIYLSYRNWYLTQTAHFPAKHWYAPSELMNQPALFVARAPGNTCMSALSGGQMGRIDAPLNHSKGCGGVMRAAPVGFLQGMEDRARDQLAMEAAAVTHGHPFGYLPAGLLAHIVHSCVYENASGMALAEIVEHSITAFQSFFADAPMISPFVAFMRRAAALAKNEASDLSNIDSLGEGWVGDEALAIALYCALRHADDFDAVLRASVNHSGDSDSTGAVTGNILGAYLGEAAIGEMWKAHLEFRALLERTADRFAGI